MDKQVKNWLKRNIPINYLKFLLLCKFLCTDYFHNFQRNFELKIDKDKLLILGNGPSLNKSINKNINRLESYDIMVVNQFAMSDLYEMIMPRYYVLADPEYFKEYPAGYVLDLSLEIKKKTRWRLTIFISERAKDSYVVNELRNIPNIRFAYYSKNGVHYEWFKNKTTLFKLLNKNMIAPPSETVLNTCISIGIYNRYKKIFIMGADTSWHEQFILDQTTNDLYMEDRHFYGEEKVLYKKHKTNATNMGEEFLGISKVFYNYQFLQEYAIYNQVNIYNASGFSWIDVFERSELE